MSHRSSQRTHNRSQHQQRKALRLRDRVRQVACRLQEQHQARMAWWRRAFRTPATGAAWAFEQARTWVEALMQMIGLDPLPRYRNDLLAAHRLTNRPSDRMKRMRVSRKLMVVEPLECRVVMTGAPELIELGFHSDAINHITEVGSDVYFVASTRAHGQEVWKLDADSPTGASLAGDVYPGPFSSNPRHLTNVNGTLYFSADSGTNGIELWRVNPSGAAEMVEDSIPGEGISPNGSGSSYPINLTNVNGTLFFTASDGVNGRELWRIGDSGTAEIVEGMTLAGGINPFSAFSGSYPYNLTNVDGTLFFTANDGSNGIELWRVERSGPAEMVDGTIPGGGINPGGYGSNPTNLTNVDGRLYFTANDGTNGYELWRIDDFGIAEIVEDAIPGGGIRRGAYGSFSSGNRGNLTNVNGTLYFTADDGVAGNELWRIDDNSIAEMVEDAIPGGGINPSRYGYFPSNLTNVNGRLFFTADNGVNGTELWRIDDFGSAEMVEDAIPGGGIGPGAYPSFPYSLTEVNGTLFFIANDGVNGRELWRIDDSGIAEMVENAIPGGAVDPGAYDSRPAYLTNANGTLFFTANYGNGIELWRVTGAGTATLVDGGGAGGGIGTGTSKLHLPVSNLTNLDGTLFFTATVGFEVQLWRSLGDGTSAARATAETFASSAGSSPSQVTGIGDKTYFTLTGDLWETDGTSGGTSRVEGVNSRSYLDLLTDISGTLYFTAADESTGGELWRINNSGLAEIVADIAPGPGGSYPSNLTNVNGNLFFVASDGTNGQELWRINDSGQAEMVEDSIPGGGIRNANYENAGYSLGSYPNQLTNLNGALFFVAYDGTNREELWRFNELGLAEMVEDSIPGGGINPTSYYSYYYPSTSNYGSYPSKLTNVNGTLYFAADDGTNGQELWRINESGLAEMVEDSIPGGGINPDPYSGSSPYSITNVNGTLFFSASDGANGGELWRVDSQGLAEIVEVVPSGGGVNQGPGGSYPSYLTNVNGSLFFTASAGRNGRELWRVESTGFAVMVDGAIPGGGINPGFFASSNPRSLTNLNGILYFTANDPMDSRLCGLQYCAVC